MNDQEKQILIERLITFRGGIRAARDANMQNEADELDDKIAEIALASLTAQPVKLPAPIGVFMFTSYVKKALEEAEIKYEVEE